MTDASGTEPLPTPAQWAVRWHAVVFAAVWLASVPLLHLWWHGVRGEAGPLLPTRSQVPGPAPTTDTVLAGTWMTSLERHLREDTPLTWWLRGTWNELRYRAGVPQSDQVHFGTDEWFYIAESVRPDRAAWDRAAPARRAFLREVKDLVARAGAELFLVVIPDKARVHPEPCYPGGVLPPEKAGNYAAILAELGELGIPTVDVAGALAAARAADPKAELYYRRDTHWRPAGALAAGQAIAAALEQRYGERLGARQRMELSGVTRMRLIGDLPANMGIGTLELPDDNGERRTAAMSLLADRFAEVREYYGVDLVTAAGKVGMFGKDPEATVLWIGTSFSEENGANAASLFLGRPLRTVIARGAVGMKPLQQALPELRGGTKAKVVVWEFVERGMFDAVWREPKL